MKHLLQTMDTGTLTSEHKCVSYVCVVLFILILKSMEIGLFIFEENKNIDITIMISISVFVVRFTYFGTEL